MIGSETCIEAILTENRKFSEATKESMEYFEKISSIELQHAKQVE